MQKSYYYLPKAKSKRTNSPGKSLDSKSRFAGGMYLHSGARVDTKHSRGCSDFCKVTDILSQRRSVEPVRSCSFEKPRDSNCCCLWTKLPGWHRQLCHIQKLPTAKQEHTFTCPKDGNQTNSQRFHFQFE